MTVSNASTWHRPESNKDRDISLIKITNDYRRALGLSKHRDFSGELWDVRFEKVLNILFFHNVTDMIQVIQSYDYLAGTGPDGLGTNMS